MTDFFGSIAEQQPDKYALIDDRGGLVRTLTYADLDARANRLGHVLLDHGVGPGERVVWCGRNSAPVVELLLAATKVGATAVPLNYRLTEVEATYITAHCDARAVFVDAELAPMFERIDRDLPKVESVLVYDGTVPDGMLDCRRRDRRRPVRELAARCRATRSLGGGVPDRGVRLQPS